MHYDTTLDRTVLDRLVDAIAPRWRIRRATATPSEAGHHIVYRLTVETPGCEETCYLKATPPEAPPTVDLEARILAILDARTSIPCPSVYGVLDEGDDLPTPAVLLESLPGTAISRTDPSALSVDRHRRLARETGRKLAELHALDAVETFGFLTCDGPASGGDPPSGGFDSVTVADPIADWRDRLRDWADEPIESLEATEFADAARRVESGLNGHIADLEGPFEPALARIDQSLENVLLDDGALSAMLDWEFTIAATPAYDAVAVAQSLSGGPFLFAPGVPDRRDLVLDALCAGYRERGPGRIVEQIRSNRDPYELLFALRTMANLEHWYGMVGLDDRTEDAADELRREVARRL